MLSAVQLKPDVYWVGALDWNAREFHGYTTEAGITYNAYLIMDEKVTLIDTAKSTFADELLQRGVGFLLIDRAVIVEVEPACRIDKFKAEIFRH